MFLKEVRNGRQVKGFGLRKAEGRISILAWVQDEETIELYLRDLYDTQGQLSPGREDTK